MVVCEDNEVYRLSLVQSINRILSENGIAGSVVFHTPAPSEVAAFLERGHANVFFLDIDLKADVTGFDLARRIRENDRRAFIVFITEHLEYMLQSFKIRPFDFLPKPVTLNVLKQCLLEIHREYISGHLPAQPEENQITVKFGTTYYCIEKDRIIFIEKFGNRSTIHTSDSVITCYESLEALEEKLNDSGAFIRCHKSFIANRRFFAEVRLASMEILFKTGHKCYIGKKYKKALEPVMTKPTPV